MKGYEKVYSYVWYDGVRSGVADFNGQPYYFESQWEDLNNLGPDSFKLSPISKDLLSIVIEDWRLWKKLEQAYKQGLVSQHTHPFLQADALEGKKLDQLLKDGLKIDETNHVKARADFEVAKGQEFVSSGIDFIVKWIIIKEE
ncbi:hypothetical protein GXP67_02310 [Rhodocytophaga rosea]|uniref:Uncharacterized protein n=1 Tax=Rhodocytophaga rosea TaxID=2704465 RepID=A0A6C0GCA0_9BACT|nr:hypothetical protein [Rhodocytophaga rosea]QHT65576.1 hypothetical protein GXP67_02310 [Rhodocytophaga rosea]